MSMTGNYLRVSERTLNDLRADPSKVGDFLNEQVEFASDEYLDIDKSWHIIHFLLTGTESECDPPLGNVVMGGTKLSGEDMGQGSCPRYLTPTEVRDVSRALEAVSPEQLVARWDSRRIAAADIYPQIWDDSPENRDYVSDNYQEVRDLFAVAAENGDAVILWLH